MKACDITAVVTGNDDTWERISVGSVPVAFGYSKFRLTPEGLVAEQVMFMLWSFIRIGGNYS